MKKKKYTLKYVAGTLIPIALEAASAIPKQQAAAANILLGDDGGSKLSKVSTMLDTIPFIGSALSSITKNIDQSKQVQDNYNNIYKSKEVSNNPYKYNFGGTIEGNMEVAKLKGNSHEEGGITVNNLGIPANTEHEAEGEEVKYTVGNKTHIFSKKMKL